MLIIKIQQAKQATFIQAILLKVTASKNPTYKKTQKQI